MIDWHDVERSASGRWFEILEAFGVATRKLNRNGPCPTCGGNDRAHYFERDGRTLLYCRQGCGNAGSGNCVSTPEFLLQQHNRWSFSDMVKAVAEYLCTAPREVIHTSRAPQSSITYPPSHLTNPEKAAADLARATECETHPLLVRENTSPCGTVRTAKDCLVVPLWDSSVRLVNLAAFSPSGQVFYSAGGPSFGATARMPAAHNDTGRVILCCDYFAGWRLWWKLKGSYEVRAAISQDNFTWMTRKMRGSFDAVAVIPDDAEEYRELGFEVVELAIAYKNIGGI